MLSSCPFCYMNIPFPELEWHVNEHIVENELEKDMELAQQIAVQPQSPRSTGGSYNANMDERMTCAESSNCLIRNPEPSASSLNCISFHYSKSLDQEKISCLAGLQIKSSFYKIEGGLMSLLRRCLELETGNSTSVISGHIDHYESIRSEDYGKGCGWRNIQMLSSHLLMQRQDAKDVMFGALGIVPDIPSLQRWLEIAWESGFDRIGSDSFNHTIYGSLKFIGATECATLFRSFGLRARIVDFDSKSDASREQTRKKRRGKIKAQEIYGPIDKFLPGKKYDSFQLHPCEKFRQSQRDFDSPNKTCGTSIDNDHHINKYRGEVIGPQVLADWVWNYFSNEVWERSNDFRRVLISEKTPLYFQHDGHSRTIVGIHMQKGLHGSPDRYSLLVLDPSQRTADLERSLRHNVGWQKLIKRGVHTLKKPQYQLCYIDPGIAPGEEIEQLKIIDSMLIEF